MNTIDQAVVTAAETPASSFINQLAAKVSDQVKQAMSNNPTGAQRIGLGLVVGFGTYGAIRLMQSGKMQSMVSALATRVRAVGLALAEPDAVVAYHNVASRIEKPGADEATATA
jgi:hypothetical protein